MANQERPQSNFEPKPKQEARDLEKPAKPTIDAAYHQVVAKYFNAKKQELAKSSDKENEDDAIQEQFLNDQKASLEKMSSAKSLEKMQPKNISLALSEIAGNMALHNPESGHVNHLYEKSPEFEEPDEKEHLDSEKVFMESCKKIFPETEAEDMSDSIEEILTAIEGLDYGIYTEDLANLDHKKLLQENPAKLLEGINDFLYFTGQMVKWRAFNKFKDFMNNDIREGDDSLDTTEEKLATANNAIYKLQLVKNQLIKRIYGREDITPGERKTIDQAKRNLK